MIPQEIGEDELRKKASLGIAWMSLKELIFQILLIVKLIIVSRLLGPIIMGTFGLYLIIVITLEQFTQFGEENALIFKPKNDNLYNTAWTIRIIKGFSLFIIIVIFHKFILTAFNLQLNILLLISSTLILEGFVNIGFIDFRKELDYSREFIFKVIPDVVNITITILLSVLLTNIWALIVGLLAERIIRITLSYSLSKFRPKFNLNSKMLLEIINYGKWVFLMGLFGYLLIQVGDIYTSITLGAITLAIYQMGFKLSILPSQSLTKIFSNVTIPTYAKLSDNETARSETFILSLFASITIYCIYISLSIPIIDLIIQLLLGDEWLPVASIYQSFTIFALLYLFMSAVEQYYLAIGMQSKLVRLQSITTFVLISVISIIQPNSLNSIIYLIIISMILINVLYYKELTGLLKIRKANWLSFFAVGMFTIILIISINKFITIFALYSIILSSILWLIFILVSNKIFPNNLIRQSILFMQKVLS